MSPAPPINKPVLSANLLLRKDLRELAANFQDARIPCMALKGAVFAHFLYKRPDLRPMEDLDLLIPGSRLPLARKLLCALGYEPVPEAAAEFKKGRTRVDLSTGIWFLPRAEAVDFWERSILLSEGDLELRAPSWEDHFIFVLAHSTVHHARWEPVHRRDLEFLLEKELDWGLLGDRLRRFRLLPAAAAAFAHLGLKTPEGLDLSTMTAIQGREARFLQRLLARERDSDIGHLLRFWTSPSRTVAVLRALFPPFEFLRRRYGTRQPALYLLLRPFLLAWDGLKTLIQLEPIFSVIGHPGERGCVIMQRVTPEKGERSEAFVRGPGLGEGTRPPHPGPRPAPGRRQKHSCDTASKEGGNISPRGDSPPLKPAPSHADPPASRI